MMEVPVRKHTEETVEVTLKVILQEVCSFTGKDAVAIRSTCRKWTLMYARYLFYDVALRFGVKPIRAARYIGRNRTMIYPYNRAVNDLAAVHSQFRKDRDNLYNYLNEMIGNGTA